MENRIIKFRAFDPNTKEVSEGKELYDFLQHNDNWFGGRIHFKSGYYAPYSDCIIMQFTGLTDKNGKEIYEWDIVRAKEWNPSTYTIEFIEGGFCATNKAVNIPTDINHFYDSTGCAIEVIGNIYSNPELLTA